MHLNGSMQTANLIVRNQDQDEIQDEMWCLRFDLIIKTADTWLPGHPGSEGNLKASDPIQHYSG